MTRNAKTLSASLAMEYDSVMTNSIDILQLLFCFVVFFLFPNYSQIKKKKKMSQSSCKTTKLLFIIFKKNPIFKGFVVTSKEGEVSIIISIAYAFAII